MEFRQSHFCLTLSRASLQAGAPATGKTTFIQNLSMTYGHNDDNDFSSPSFKRTMHSPMQHSTSTGKFLESFTIDPTRADDFVDWPADLCTRVDLSDESAKIDYQIFVQVSHCLRTISIHARIFAASLVSMTCLMYMLEVHDMG